MSKMTFVVEFEDGKEPPIQFTNNFFGTGGSLCCASTFDYRKDLLTEDEYEIIDMALRESLEFYSGCTEGGIDAHGLLRKIELLQGDD